jgi:transcriptional regulator with XRE-family HTH domain
MEALIKDLCKEKKDSLNLTNQNIADRANLSASTVNNYFSESSKAPSVYTVGPICAALGVSLDSYFGIKSDKRLVDDEDILEIRLKHAQEKYFILQKGILHRNKVIIALFVLCGILLGYAIIMDLLNPSIGLIRG